MSDKELIIGIDVGWSEKRPSCGIAIIDPLNLIRPLWPTSAITYGEHAAIMCCKLRLSELLDFLGKIPKTSYSRKVVVVDGPLGPEGPPRKNREVDSAFRRHEFNGRMQPMDIEGNDGGTYVEATYRIANSFEDSFVPWPFSQATSNLLIAETHPTVGLALFNRKQNINELPTRKRPLVPPSSQPQERAVRAKSDFYWRIGGSKQCESILRCIGVSKEQDHERVAALYCLAVAASLAKGEATAVGKIDSGMYVFPSHFHLDWLDDIKSIGLIGKNPSLVPDLTNTDCFSNWKSANIAVTPQNQRTTSFEEENDNAPDPEKIGDTGGLLLNDNGGVHEKHNSWLTNFSNCVDIRFIEQDLNATLIKGKSPGHWKIDSKNGRALGIAQQFGFDGLHLSNENSLLLEFEVVRDCSQNSDV